MRIKALCTLAAFAVGTFMAVAQSNVYSVNVVGYVNKDLPTATFVPVANPLDDGTNTLDSVAGALANKSSAQFWNGGTGTFDSYTKGGGAWPVGAPATPVGLGFFLKSAGSITNTFVGEVVAAPGGSVTNSLPAATLVFIGSAIPYGGDLNDSNLNLALPNKSQAQLWNSGTELFDNYTRGGGAWPVNPGVDVAEGFFLNSATAYDWVQTLPAN